MTHLCVRTYYSLLNGMMSPNELVLSAKKLGFSSIAITEQNVLYSAWDFQRICDREKMKAIFGMEILIKDKEQHYYSLLLARNEEGFKKLVKISKIIMEQNSIKLSLLEDYFDSSLVLVLYSENGPFENYYSHDDWKGIETVILKFKKMFPKFYLGISHEESAFFRPKNSRLIAIGKKHDVSSIALPKVYYRKPEDAESLRILQAIDQSVSHDDKSLVLAPNRHLLSKKEIEDIYDSELLENLKKLEKSLNCDLNKIKTSLPDFPLTENVGQDLYLKKLSYLGLEKRRQGNINKKDKDRLDYELKVIKEREFSNYFLIVYDLVRFAKVNNIYVGPGRGSSAGSLVAFSLGITDVDPIKYNLIFERFLNPERQEMPDIDIDFPDNRRDEVIDYLRGKYGDEHVAHIVTFGTMRARQAFRDVAKVFSLPQYKIDQTSKLIQSDDLEKSLENNWKLKKMLSEDSKLEDAYHQAKKVQDLPRHTSLHAAGLVLSKKSFFEGIPFFTKHADGSVIQYNMDNIEELGLIKIDLLGLRNLTVIDEIKNQLNNFDIKNIDTNDRKTFELLSQGKTLGIFQLESEGMTQLLKQMKPYRFLDLVDAIALYRPGPMKNIPQYLQNREKNMRTSNVHEVFDELTYDTYGVLIYQEQIMQASVIMAGFSMTKADHLRKSMSSKNREELNSLKEEFIKGSVKNGYSLKTAEETFKLILRFSDYGFNKSHSVAYARIAYEMAYLKAHYPLVFYPYLLDSVISNVNKTKLYLDEMVERKIPIAGLDINYSKEHYYFSNKGLYLPLNLVKGISRNVALEIVNERQVNGRYLSYADAISRLTLIGLSRHHFLALIRSGAFDTYEFNRESLEGALEEVLSYASLITVIKNGKKSLNLSLVSEPKVRLVSENNKKKLDHEKDYLGFYFSEHPSDFLQKKHQTDLISNIVNDQKKYRLIVMVENIKEHRTKNDDLMAFLEVSDASGSLDLVVFPNVYAYSKEIIEEGAILLVSVRKGRKDSYIVQKLYRFT